MYNIKFENYVPEPQPAAADRIVAAHYYPAWKYGAAQIHEGFNDLAEEYPDRTPLMGYYDEENPEVCDWEIKWALEHGINCFIYCWYRKKENEGKAVSVENIRCSHGLHEALFNAKYRDMMNFAIMYENSGRWGATDKRDLIENLIPFWTENYFKRENYLKLDGKPILFICDTRTMNRFFASVDEQKKAFDECREYLREQGFEGLYIAAAIWDYNEADTPLYKEIDERGYDFHFSYNAGYSPKENLPSDEEIIKGQCDMLRKRLEYDNMRHIPIASCFRDATPRTTPAWMKRGFRFDKETVFHLSADGFRRTLREMKKIADGLPDGAWGRRIFMIDNWNEWDEGHFVSPSHQFGFKYLQAIREELTERDNLPDYRSPQDQGFTGYNTSWKTPDFAEFCKKKLEEK